ncbi:unnamed protein product [Rhizoctonia solani]|uniref:Uncharacterized protein n=1 Tax=Rhizoctonia solani TaxID=456999 RepID=A0A8H3E3Z1_9AGAM|nr:unnamed protein product [Rhizoctonia solani]
MDSPLTVAELSRLRKAIQQRDRLAAQGLATSGVDLRISSALSNLKLYLPSQTQLAAVLKDWETSDAVKKSQIIIWLQQNILGDTPSRESPPPPALLSRPAFIHPPPPPVLPSRKSSVISQPSSLSATPPIGTSARVTPIQAPPSTNNAYPLREIHTQASLRPPTPPPKERISGIVQDSLTRRHTLAGPLRQSRTLVDSPTSEGYANSPANNLLYPSTFSGSNSSQPSVTSASSSNISDSTRRFGSQTSQSTPPSHSHTPSHDSSQYYAPSSLGQPATTQSSATFAQGYPTPPGSQGGLSSYNQQFIDAWSKIQTQQAQQSAMLIQQLTQAQQPPTSNSTAQILAAAQQYQAQHQANFLQQLQAQQAATSNNTVQLLANLQQQQQAQTNQMMSMLQQYQQNAPTSTPSQNFQSSQQTLDLLSQMQSGGAPGVDWASLAGGTGMDPSTLMSLVMGGMDPTNLAVQGVSFMFG